MDTTQKTREAALPESAQQRNGAVRSAEEQRSAAGLPKRTATPEQKPSAPGQRQAAPRAQKTPARQSAAKQKRPASAEEKAETGQRKPASAPAQNAVKQRKAAPRQAQTAAKQRKAAPKQTQAAQKQRKAAPKQEQPRQVGLPDSVSTKKRAYGNSKPKKKTTLTLVNDALKKSTQRSAEKIKARQAEREKGPRKNRPQQPAPAVIYTQPQAFNRSRFFMQLLTVTAVVVALVLGLSVFFKVENITVSGADVYSPWAVREASGISEGDNLLTFSHARAGAKIKANLPYVNRVRFGIKLPDTVNIIIEEEDVVYAIKTQDGTWWLMNSSGRMVEQANSAVAANYTQVLGVTVDYPVSGERGVATESAAVAETDPNTGEEVVIPVSVTGAQRLNVALEILKALEANDIVGDAASVDVTRLEDIILWYGTRYQVNLGDSGNIDYKIDCMNDVILQMSEYQSGILDISFTIWPNQVGYTPFG